MKGLFAMNLKSWAFAAAAALSLSGHPAFAEPTGVEAVPNPAAIAAQAEYDHPTGQKLCAAFIHNHDGSWTPRRAVEMTSPPAPDPSWGTNTAWIGSQTAFMQGVTYSGVPIADILDQTCGG